MHLTLRLWRDQRGETSAMAMLLLTTVVALGAIAGLATLRDHLVQELGDAAAAIDNLDQSYSTPFGEFMDPGPFYNDPPNQPPPTVEFVD